MIIEVVDFSLFESRFRDYGRQDQFSYHGLRALFEYLESYSEDQGKPFELDVIGICCEFYEDSVENVLKEYDCETLEELEQETTVISVDDETIIMFKRRK